MLSVTLTRCVTIECPPLATAWNKHLGCFRCSSLPWRCLELAQFCLSSQNIPKRRHKTSGTLGADHQGIYHHMTTKIKTGHSWFAGVSNLPSRSLGGPTAARPPGQETEKSWLIYGTSHAWVSYSDSGWMGTPTLTSGAILLLLATFLLIF